MSTLLIEAIVRLKDIGYRVDDKGTYKYIYNQYEDRIAVFALTKDVSFISYAYHTDATDILIIHELLNEILYLDKETALKSIFGRLKGLED